jgi:hypothetical protein
LIPSNTLGQSGRTHLRQASWWDCSIKRLGHEALPNAGDSA